MLCGVQRIHSIVKSYIITEVRAYEISLFSGKAIIVFPFIVVFLYSVFLMVPLTRDEAIGFLEENGPIEFLTFVFAIVGGIQGLWLVGQIRKHGEQFFVSGFYAFFSVGLIFIAMEEVAWGQWFFGFETPQYWMEVNNQEEMTFHNLDLFNHHLEVFPLIFGLGGLLGVWLSFRKTLSKIVPSIILLPWFLIITITSAIDLLQDFYIIQKQFDYLVNFLDEVIEMMVGLSGLCFIWLSLKKFSTIWKKEAQLFGYDDRFSQSAPFN